MKRSTTILFLLLFVFLSCNKDDYALVWGLDHPNKQDLTSHNPFNDLEPSGPYDNSLGFYDRNTTYRQPTYNPRIFEHPFLVYSKFLCYPDRDTLLIQSDVLPYPESYNNDLGKYSRYYTEIAFLISKADRGSDGSYILPGSSVMLRDQKANNYNVNSAWIELEDGKDCTIGRFEVLFEDSSGNLRSLSGGRFKLKATIINRDDLRSGESLTERYKKHHYDGIEYF